MFVASLLVYPLTNGAQALAVARARRGEAPHLLGALRGALRRCGALWRTSVLVSAAVLAVLVAFVVLAGMVPRDGQLLLVIGLLAALLGLMTWVSLYTQVIVLEGAPGGLACLRRSVQLVRGRFREVLGVTLGVALVAVCVQGALLGLAVLLGSPPGGWVRLGLVQLGGACTWTLCAVAGTVVYYRLRAGEEEAEAQAQEVAGEE